MIESHRETLSIILTLFVVVLAGFIVHRFFPSMLWASIICIASFPLYQKAKKYLCDYENLTALLFTCAVAILIIIPLFWLVTLIVKETQLFINYLMWLNQHGQPVPEVLSQLPFFSDEVTRYWQKHFAAPSGVKPWLSSLHLSLSPLSYYAKKVGYVLAHKSVQIAFTLLALFFFYRDGERLAHQINMVGNTCLGSRWRQYATQLPGALRAAVNGTVVVGLGVGVIMGIVYWLLGFQAPALAGFFTAIAATIPFVVPIVFAIVALLLWISQNTIISAIIVLVLGTIVMFIADHFIKPFLIGGSIKLPFLMVLFGILGGVETLGIIGLFIGPIIMAMFMTLWRELQVN